MHLDHPDGDMHVVLIMVVTVSNTEGGKAEMIEKLKNLRFLKYLATLLPRHGLATLPWDGFTFLLGVVEAVLLGHVVALLVADNVARLRWYVLALLPLHLSGHDTTLLGGDIATDRPRA